MEINRPDFPDDGLESATSSAANATSEISLTLAGAQKSIRLAAKGQPALIVTWALVGLAIIGVAAWLGSAAG